MQQVYVQFEDVEQVRKFISIIEKMDGDFDLGSGSRTVDAKSVIGVFGLDLTKPQMLTYDSDDKCILEKITPFLAAV
ncbi:MAG: HPr family phosphocarrier protein [Eubacteriales bacterium]|nr:HPr family phosphocarrier protein [Eubacteriales bacterium]